MKKNFLYALLCVTFLTGFLSCEKTSKDDKPKNDLAVIADRLTPGDVFILKPNFKLEGESWTITVNEQPAQLVRLSDSTLGLTVPYLLPGTIKADFSAVKGPVKTLTIAAYTPVSDVAGTLSGFNASLNQAMEDVSTTMPEHAAMFAQLSETYTRLSAGLTDAEKQELAFYLRKIDFGMPGGVVDDKGNPLGREMSTAGFTAIKVPAVIHNDHEYYSAKLGAVTLGITSAAGLLVAVPILAAPDPTTVSQLASIAAIAASTYVGFKAIKFWNVASVYKGEAKEVQTGSFSSSFNRVGARVATDGDTVLVNNTPVSFSANVVYANMSVADRHSATLSGRVIVTLEGLVKTYNRLANKLNAVGSWFSSTPVVTPMTLNIPQTTSTVLRKAPGNLLSIENVSAANVTFAVKGTDTSCIVTPSSASSERINISFDLVYTHKEMEMTARKKITAVFDGKEIVLDGKWKVRRIVAVSNPEDTVPIRTNGEIFYTFVAGGDFKVTQRSYEGYAFGGTIVYDWHGYSLYFVYHYNDVGWSSNFGEKWKLSADKKTLTLTVRTTNGGGSMELKQNITRLTADELVFVGPRSRGDSYPYTYYLSRVAE